MKYLGDNHFELNSGYKFYAYGGVLGIGDGSDILLWLGWRYKFKI
jgi:hypothetical protein